MMVLFSIKSVSNWIGRGTLESVRLIMKTEHICNIETNAFYSSFFSLKLHKNFLRTFQNRVIYNVRSNLDSGFLGEVTEWLKVLAWNAGVVKATEGSNPSLTAIICWTSLDTNILNDGRVPVTVDP